MSGTTRREFIKHTSMVSGSSLIAGAAGGASRGDGRRPGVRALARLSRDRVRVRILRHPLERRQLSPRATYLDKLEERGELDNTIVAFASDHGETLGDHDHWGKSVPWEASVAVPMVVAGPGVQRGAKSNALVSVIDLSATFLGYGTAESLERMNGFSMRPLLEGKTRSHREHLLCGLGQWRLVFDGRYKLVTNFQGVETRLYDLHDDPHEENNLAEKDPARVAKLRDLLRQGSYRPHVIRVAGLLGHRERNAM